MIRFKPSPLMLMLGLIAPLCRNAADYCIKVNNGFGNGGTSFIGKGFALPAAGACQPWSGFAKTASSVIAISAGTGAVPAMAKCSSSPFPAPIRRISARV